MHVALIVLLVSLAALLAASQLILPRYLGARIADRLTQGGGTARVSLEALPAARLLAGDGDRIRVSGDGLSVELTRPRPDVFGRLDGFGQVDVRLTDVCVGPFHSNSLQLSRAADDSPYVLALSARVSPRELSRFTAFSLVGPLGALFGNLAGSLSRLADTAVTVELRTEIHRVDGRWSAAGGSGTVAALPAGPMAEALAAAIVARL